MCFQLVDFQETYEDNDPDSFIHVAEMARVRTAGCMSALDPHLIGDIASTRCDLARRTKAW
jgi:hypothetical protein